jgi:hypothetical protein
MGLKLIQKTPDRHYIEVWADASDSTWSFAPDDGLLEEIDLWVREHKMGRRTSHNGWMLRGPAFLTAFILRWQPN